jgi:hypothetical protein
MLLLLTLLAPQDQWRVLVDALLHVSPVSRAAVCRSAGVQPAALSRFLDPDTTGQISHGKQLHLLAALGWPNGELDTRRAHVWRVQSVEAATWLLRVKLHGEARLLSVTTDSAHSGAPRLLVGDYRGAPLVCQAWRGVQDLTPLLADENSKALNGKRLRKVTMDATKVLTTASLTREQIEAAIAQPSEVSPRSVNAVALAAQLGRLGLDADMHTRLLQDWLTLQCNRDPVGMASALAGLDELTLSSGPIPTKTLTPAQRTALVQRLQRRPLSVFTTEDLA